MRVMNKYRLELHWDTVEYPEDNVAVLKEAYFTGPVLKEAAQLQGDDQLMLDVTQQHMVFIPDYYQAVLNWKGVEYRDNKVFLEKAMIKGKHINSIEALNDTDFILIDCKEHEEEKHPYHLVYWAEVCKENKEAKY